MTATTTMLTSLWSSAPRCLIERTGQTTYQLPRSLLWAQGWGSVDKGQLADQPPTPQKLQAGLQSCLPNADYAPAREAKGKTLYVWAQEQRDESGPEAA